MIWSLLCFYYWFDPSTHDYWRFLLQVVIKSGVLKVKVTISMQFTADQGGFMAKGKNAPQKTAKKKSDKTLKEKRKEKKEKKAQKGKI